MICLECGYETTGGVSRLGHDWYDEYEVDYAPTCTKDGQESRHCSRCNWRLDARPIPAGHPYGEWEQVDDAKCGEYGRFEHFCSLCGQIEVMNAPVDHDYSIENVVVEATCTTEGSKTLECSCGVTKTETIPATGHNYESVVTAPTCTEKGYTTFTCACGDSYVDDYVDATGHSHTSEITTPATHLTEGVETFTCACGDTYTETIDKIAAHNYESVVTEPTCTEKGYTTYTCECGHSYIGDYVDVFHRSTKQYERVITSPTCAEEGSKEIVTRCMDCNMIISREIIAITKLSHSPADTVEENYVAPTCTDNGSKDVVVYCSVCGEEVSRETVSFDATGHTDNDGNGYCDVCDENICDHKCHKGGFLWRITLFFSKIFRTNKMCECGVAHY